MQPPAEAANGGTDLDLVAWWVQVRNLFCPMKVTQMNLLMTWMKEDQGLVGSMVPQHIKPVLAQVDQELESCKSAYDYYKIFQPDSSTTPCTSQKCMQSKPTMNSLPI